MENRKKLYKVTLKGMTYSYSSGMTYGISYAVAENLDEAYQKVKKFLNDNDIGLAKDRELYKIELIADDNPYTNVGCLLYL